MNEEVQVPVGSYEDVLIGFLEDSDYNPSRGGSVEHHEKIIERLKTERETFNLSEEETRKFIEDEYQKNLKTVQVLRENVKFLKDYQTQTMRVYAISLEKETEIPKVRNKRLAWEKKEEKGQFYLDLMNSLQQRLAGTEKELVECERLSDVLLEDSRKGSTKYIESRLKEIDRWISFNERAIKNRQKEAKSKKKLIKEIKQTIEQSYMPRFN